MNKKGQALALAHDCLEIDSHLRTSWLRSQCGEDQSLFNEAHSVLALCGMVDDFMEDWPAGQIQDMLMDAPKQIGPYYNLEEIGHGGMGVVYKAQQDTPKRQVALKMISGPAGKGFLSRFAAEYQTLAQMNNPNIISVYDVGEYQKRPYFVMEFFPGQTVTHFANEHNLDMEARLKLIIMACRGLEHAHRKAVIHRDIKPSNLIVRRTAKGDNLLKVIDFGIAKADNRAELIGHTLHTEAHHMLGTPAYMSPEQIEAPANGVDTRTDVYSLGAVLYELVTGQRPFDARRLADVSLSEMIRIIREEEPPNVNETALKNGMKRPGREISWIINKAMHKDVDRRYASISQFEEDLVRYLAGNPIQAGPGALAYKMQKLFRRYWAVFSTTIILVMAMILVAGSQMTAAREQDSAKKLKTQLDKFLLFIDRTLSSSNPYDYSTSKNTITLLEQAASEVSEVLGDQPELQLEVFHTMSKTLASLGHYKQAIIYKNKELELIPEKDQLPDLIRKARLQFQAGELVNAESSYRRLVPKVDRIYGVMSQEALEIRRWLGSVWVERDCAHSAIPFFRRILVQAHTTKNTGEIARISLELGNAYLVVGDHENADAYYTKAKSLFLEESGQGSDMELVTSEINLALLLIHQNRPQEAITRLRWLLNVSIEAFGGDDPKTLECIAHIGFALNKLGNYSEANYLLNWTSSVFKQRLGYNHWLSRDSLNNTAISYHGMGRLTRAIQIGQELVDNHQFTSSSYFRHSTNLATFFIESKRLSEARGLLSKVIPEAATVYKEYELPYFLLRLTQAELFDAERDFTNAETLLEELVRIGVAFFDPDFVYLGFAKLYLGRAQTFLGKYPNASSNLESAREILKNTIYEKKTEESLQALVERRREPGVDLGHDIQKK